MSCYICDPERKRQDSIAMHVDEWNEGCGECFDEFLRSSLAVLPDHLDGEEHPCAGSCIGCGAGPDEPCFPPCGCDYNGECEPAERVRALRALGFRDARRRVVEP